MVRGRGRGRGRGASRGTRGRGGFARGRGGIARGRGGAGRGRRGRGRGGRTTRTQLQNSQNNQETKTETVLDIEKDPASYFTSNATFEQHFDAQNSHRSKYLATLLSCETYSIEYSANAKARALAAAFARHDREMMDFFMYNNKQFGFVDVLKAITILDSAREIRAKEKKLKRIEVAGQKMKPHNLGKVKNDINNLALLKPKVGSASGAVARYIRKWVRKFTKDELEFFALHMPTEQWRKLANIVHFNPDKDFPNATWFLPYCFGADPPKDSMVDKCRNMTEANVNELVEQFDIPYTVLKKFVNNFNDKTKLKVAEKQDKLDTIIWYYEDLKCPAIDDIIRSRLENGEKLTLGYGKLMERLLMFKDLMAQNSDVNAKSPLFNSIIPIAEQELKKFNATIASPVAVIGDASGSMSQAIRTATIISSLLTAICSAKLSFFNTENFYAKKNPKDIAEVIEVAYETQADGGTAPAASLVPYFDNKEVVKTFVIVTDEEENEDGITEDKQHWRFYKLFMEYREKVYPASLIFISFLRHQHAVGEMYQEFLNNNVPDVSQYKFDVNRPDLTKLDSILGRLCSNTSKTFLDDVSKAEELLKSCNLKETATKIDALK